MLLDSNIIIYAINKKSPKYKGAREFILNFSKKYKFVVAQQNILESFRVLTHPKFSNPYSPKEALTNIGKFARQIPLICPQEETVQILYKFIEKHNLKGDQIFDAYLVATMISNGIKDIATDNERDFSKFKIINIYNPFTEN